MIDKIYELLEHMDEELEDAEEYAEYALACAAHNMHNASTYQSMAEDELKHFDKLSEMLKAHKDVGEDMKSYIEMKHAHMLKKRASIKTMIAHSQI